VAGRLYREGSFTVAQLSEWLQIMLGEIARKQQDQDRAREEQELRDKETPAPASVAARDDSSASRR
jgi:hypothetical protein